jgi:hypothetical protein
MSWGNIAVTDEFVEATYLRGTADSLRRIAARLPAELRVEIQRVAGRLDEEAERLEAKLAVR